MSRVKGGAAGRRAAGPGTTVASPLFIGV